MTEIDLMPDYVKSASGFGNRVHSKSGFADMKQILGGFIPSGGNYKLNFNLLRKEPRASNFGKYKLFTYIR